MTNAVYNTAGESTSGTIVALLIFDQQPNFFQANFFLSFFLILTFILAVGVEDLLVHLIKFSDAHTHTQTHTPPRTPLDEGSALRRDFYITHNSHKRQTSMPLAGFEPAITVTPTP